MLHETERKVHLISPWFSHLHFGGETVQRIKSIYHSKCKMVSVLSHLNSAKLKTRQPGRPPEKAEPGSEWPLPLTSPPARGSSLPRFSPAPLGRFWSSQPARRTKQQRGRRALRLRISCTCSRLVSSEDCHARDPSARARTQIPARPAV